MDKVVCETFPYFFVQGFRRRKGFVATKQEPEVRFGSSCSTVKSNKKRIYLVLLEELRPVMIVYSCVVSSGLLSVGQLTTSQKYPVDLLRSL